MSCVGTVLSLERHRLNKRSAGRPAVPRATLYFDLASPYTYLVAERADRLFAGLLWRPASSDMLGCAVLTSELRRAASERAAVLRLPLVWPDEHPCSARGAMRVASLAAERGCAAEFVLAASRLAYCGGFDIDDPEILAEAAAAAGIGLAETFQAAGDPRRDGPIEETGRLLLAAGAARLPALRVGRLLFSGEERLHEAAAARAAV